MRRILAVIIIFAAGCTHGDARRPAGPSASATPDSQTNEEAADRAELVLPAPYFWQPATPDAALKLTLLLERTTLKAGDKVRYHLELQNTGSKDVSFSEDPSFIKLGTNHIEYHAYLTEPGKGERPLVSDFIFDSRQATPEEMRKRGRSSLHLTLHTGETLITRPDTAPPVRFRDLDTILTFHHPGRYRLRFVYDRAGDPKLRSDSNTVEFDVVP